MIHTGKRLGNQIRLASTTTELCLIQVGRMWFQQLTMQCSALSHKTPTCSPRLPVLELKSQSNEVSSMVLLVMPLECWGTLRLVTLLLIFQVFLHEDLRATEAEVQ